MLKKQFRLPKGTSLAHGVTISTPYFIMKIAKNALPLNRFGFVVSKKVDTRATKRNSVKRNVRAHIETMQEKLVRGHDFLFIVKKQALDASAQELYNAVEKAMVKQHLLQ